MSSGLGWSTKGLQNVCPTGIATFDSLIGGGFALSTLNIIDEDCDRVYSSMLTKAYISSAIVAKQNLIIFSNTIKNKNSRFLRELPLFKKSSEKESEERSEEAMKIAFRYSNLPSRYLNSQEGEDVSNQKFDFGSALDQTLVEDASIQFYDHSEILTILEKLVSQQQTAQIYRILIDEVGAPYSILPVNVLPKLFHRVKVLMRHLSSCVCLATLVYDQTSALPTGEQSGDLLESIAPFIRDRIHMHADSVIRLIDFGDDSSNINDNSNPYRSDYVGFLHLLRLPRLNSFAPYNPTLEATEFGIKLRNSKRYLAIERLALPPDLGETVNRFTSSCSVSTTNF